MEDYNPKKEDVPYTIAIIKPDLTQNDEKIKEVLTKIESHGFSILQMIKKELTKQEVLNLYYKHTDKEFFDNMAKYLMNGESVVLLLTAENEDPIRKWKTVIGLPDPVEAKKVNGECLRTLYGTSLMKNALHGSDNKNDANKERDIFKFPIPQRVPEFKFEKFKVTLDMLLKFIYPPNLEHPNVNSRLDIFGLYGPALNHHSVDSCFCKPCSRIGKEYLQKVIYEKIEEKKQKLGITAKPMTSARGSMNSMATMTMNSSSKINVAPIRLLDEKGIIELWPYLCESCRFHCENQVHLVCGREQQHVMTNQEIAELSNELNKDELHKLLAKEKGSTADVMIEYLEIKEPKEIQYDRRLITHLFRTIKTDFYERYNFLEMQNIILEDRRIRMNAWVSKLIGKPLDAFINPKLLDTTVQESARIDPQSVNFVLSRTKPLSYSIKQKDINAVPTQFEASIVDKKRLRQNEERVVVMKLLHRNSHHIVSIDEVENNKDFEKNIFIMRTNYHPGRNGSWNNYSTLKGIRKGTYVKTIISQRKRLIE